MTDEIFIWSAPEQDCRVPVHYKKSGNGPFLVLLHGFTESLRIWDTLTEALSLQYTVIRPDLPGHGRTPEYSNTHTMEEMAEMLAEMLANYPPCILIGHSMGGYVALAYAEKYSERLLGIGLFHSTAAADSVDKKEDRLRASALALQDKKGFITSLIPKLFAPKNRLQMSAQIDVIKALANDTSATGISAALLGMRQRPDRTHVLKTIPVPVLMLYGAFDELIPPARSETEASLPAICISEKLKSSGHMGFIEEPEETYRIIKTFAARCIQ